MVDERENHRQIAVNCFNATWDLLDRTDRTPEDDLQMIHCAHASRYHWGVIGSSIEFQRGEWQISRVYSVLGMGESALYHAEICNQTCVEEGIGDFDMAFSLEAMARAHMVLGNTEDCGKYLELAKEAADQIEEKDTRDYFLSEIESISC